jgi:single-strand DNA-binding protein
MVNKVILVGRLTADPDIRALPSGTFLANMRMATNTYGGKDEDGTKKEYTEFHSLVAFARLAELAGELLRKGRLVYVEGRLRHRTWDNGEGQKRHSTEIVIDNFQLIDSKHSVTEENVGQSPPTPGLAGGGGEGGGREELAQVS